MIHYDKKSYVCFVDLAMDLLGSKWKGVILCHLKEGAVRFSKLQSLSSNISQKVLSESLKSLVKEDLVIKTVYNESPPKVEYCLSDKGKEITQILLSMEDWALKYYQDKVVID